MIIAAGSAEKQRSNRAVPDTISLPVYPPVYLSGSIIIKYLVSLRLLGTKSSGEKLMVSSTNTSIFRMANSELSEDVTKNKGMFISATNEFDARMACLARLETFSKCLTDLFVHVKPADLAAAGFEYMQRDDLIRCNHCGVEIRDWKERDNPVEVHRNRSRNCRFLQENCMISDGSGDGSGSGTASVGTSLVAESQETASATDDATARINKLQSENKKMRDELTCRMCKVEKVQTLFLPCRHLVVCEHCAERLENCCSCQGKILGTVRVVMVPKLQ